MDADERLTALKKAYVDIILNTAKEAAARIMVSERKALRFQHELSAAKEDSLHMLLRLKRMMDSKDKETEMASFSQQKKIGELEAQLQEAEDIVNDLRQELRGVQAELDRATKVKEITCLEHHIGTPLETPAEHRFEISQSKVLHPSELQCESILASDVGYSNVNHRNEGQKFYSTLVHMGNSYVGKRDLPSIILRSKEPELYRNGCTQRIRACERSPLNEELSFNEEKRESSVKDEKEGDRIRKAPAPFYEPDTMCNTEKNEVHQEDGRVSHWSGAHVVKSIRKKRTRASRFSRNPSRQYQLDQINKADLILDISCLNSPNSAENSTHSGEDPFEMAQRVSSDTNELGQGCTNTVNEVERVGDELVTTRQEISESIDMLEAPIDQTNLGKVYVPLVSSESKASESTITIPFLPVADRIIKYTFQRKRKRETLNNSAGNTEETSNISEVNASIGIAVREKENCSLEPENSNLVGESSRDNRRLSQVARQRKNGGSNSFVCFVNPYHVDLKEK